MSYLDQVKLTPLMALSSGVPEIVIGLIDGPVMTDHPDLGDGGFRELRAKDASACAQNTSLACQHGTFVAGILSAKRNSVAPAICPQCSLLIRPIFAAATSPHSELPSATPEELAEAILESISAGARILNISAAIAPPSSKSERSLEEALNLAAMRGVMVVTAAGNQGLLGGTAITRHPWVIPVVAYNARGMPMGESNMGGSIGKRGLGAPGQRITSLGTGGKPLTLGGTSAAAPFVTGAIALLWSIFSQATATQIKLSVVQSFSPRRNSVMPPLLDAWRAYKNLLAIHGGEN